MLQSKRSPAHRLAGPLPEGLRSILPDSPNVSSVVMAAHVFLRSADLPPDPSAPTGSDEFAVEWGMPDVPGDLRHPA